MCPMVANDFEDWKKTKEFPSEPSYVVIDGHIKSKLKALFVRSQIFPSHDSQIRPIFFFPKNQSNE